MFDPNLTFSWVIYADRSYVATRLLFFSGLWFEASFNAHRTVELYLKAYIVSKGGTISPDSPGWGHKLGQLGEECSRYCFSFKNVEVTRRLHYFERYFQFVRYPNEEPSPNDGSLTWFSYDSNILPLDELVAFIRPRIYLTDKEWIESYLFDLYNRPSVTTSYPKRALTDHNDKLEIILCNKTNDSSVEFTKNFNFDKPGC